MSEDQAESSATVGDPSKTKRVDVPHFYASSFITHVTSDVTIIFQSPTLVTFPSNSGAPIETLASTSVGAVSMSIQAAKDLAKLLENNVKAYEDMFGEVTTPWMELQKKQAEGNDS